ncbi:hypothetical protein [Limosilactobacillus caecicola]|uniref:hypothetical protein n=1 Tax=Limosilactobacillus caecicola TaxID=2941332 RepID=UPI00203D4F05|nr:hypothetical protein [Limosilactobacillus caecicola]
MDNDTKKLLGITDPNLKFPDHWLKAKQDRKGHERLEIEGTLTYSPAACPNCGVIILCEQSKSPFQKNTVGSTQYLNVKFKKILLLYL